MRVSVVGIAVIAGLAAPAGTVAAEDLAEQLDAIAPFVNAKDLDSIGGPDDPGGIVAGLDGQWFPLNNTVRNWGKDGFDAEGLAQSMARSCAEDATASTFYEATGDSSFSVREVLRSYDTEFHMVLTHVEGRRFAASFDDDEFIRSYGKEDASEAEKAEILEMAAQLRQQAPELWRPTEDILIVQGGFGIDVTGRCPAP
jgi:hypothetical protein